MPNDLSTTNDLLRRLVRSAEQDEMGLRSDPPGTVTLYANRVKAPQNCCWYRRDPQAEENIPVAQQYVRGRLVDLVCYDKQSSQGKTTKARAALDAGRTRYEIETSLAATSGRGLVAGLVEAGSDALKLPITVGVEPADKDQVLFMSVFTDEGGKQYPDSMPSEKSALVSALETVRGWMGLEADPWTDRFTRSAPHEPDAPQGGADQPPSPPPPGTPNGQGDSEGEIHPKAKQKINEWDQALADIDDQMDLAEGISAVQDVIDKWPTHREREYQDAVDMLDTHRQRLKRKEEEEDTFEPDDELPF